MAVWQVSFEFVPVKWAEENNFKVESLYGDSGFDTACAWIENQPAKDLDAIFSSILPKAVSWSEDLALWGDDKVHDINVWCEKGEILSIGFRLDLRENIKSIMPALCAVAASLNCVLFVPGQKIIINPNVFELKRCILKSDAAKFARDPEGSLSGYIE